MILTEWEGEDIGEERKIGAITSMMRKAKSRITQHYKKPYSLISFNLIHP